MGTINGAILGYKKIIDNGPAPCRFNIVLISEGFTGIEIPEYQDHTQIFIDKLFITPPFAKMRPATNVYRIDIASTDSGPDDPVSCGGTGKVSSTFFDSSFRSASLRRLLTVDFHSVNNIVNEIVPQWHQIIVIVNNSDWGGVSGSIATTTVATGWVNMAIHDLKLAAYGLIDESPNWDGIVLDTGKDDRVIADDEQYSGSSELDPGTTPDDSPITQTLKKHGRSNFYKRLFFQHLRVNHEFWKG